MQIIISCGGGGTRLWPVSTDQLPKQLIPLLDDESLMLKTYKRIRRNFSAEQIWVTVNEKHLQTVKDILPEEFNSNHIIAEPVKRDTFAAISLASAIIAKETSIDEPLIFIPSDDWIENEDDINKLNKALIKIGENLADKKFEVITVGIKPSSPSTQFGYLEVSGNAVTEGNVIPVKSFKEKPSLEVAEEYLNSGQFYWHKHNPSLTFNSLIQNIQQHWPELLQTIQNVYNNGEFSLSDFEAFPKLSLDYAILEKSKNIGMIALDISWDDLGTWETVYNYLSKLDGNNNIELLGDGNKVKLEDPNLKVAFVGVSNLLVVQTKDGLLILDPKYSGEVKNVAEHFNKK
jgi:mannose-1-phosphate guanylyltransferase/mannose-6-phosphate isomerase